MKPGPSKIEWWVVESEPLGRTAMPGRLLAYQGAEVLKAAPFFNKVHAVRRANPADVGDRLAVEQSRQELYQVQLNAAQVAGVFSDRRNLRHV